MNSSFPSQLGYRMPAEWEKHAATWLAWPHNPETWSDLKSIESIYVDFVEILSQGETIHLLVQDETEKSKASRLFSKRHIDLSKVTFHEINTCDAWIRDYGPNFIVKEEKGKRALAVNRWIFNAWGSKYEEHLQDDEAAKQILNWLKLPIFETNFILEGGSIDSNGNGIILTTAQCLLNQNRNKHLSKEKIEMYLKKYLSAKEIIWLSSGIEGDDTDGHVDDIARFVNINTILTIVEENRRDPNYKLLQENLKILKQTRIEKNKLNIVELPMPRKIESSFGRLPASYANFYIANQAVLVPIFGDPNDSIALKIIENCFCDRKVIGIRCEKLVEGLGGIHCLTHEEPQYF